MDIAVFARFRYGHLTFQIEMVLSAHPDSAPSAQRRGVQGGLDVALGHALWGFDIGFNRHCLIDGQKGGQIMIMNFCEAGRPAGLVTGFGGDGKQGLTIIIDFVFGEQGIVAGKGADVILARNVFRSDHGHHPRGIAYGRQIHL